MSKDNDDEGGCGCLLLLLLLCLFFWSCNGSREVERYQGITDKNLDRLEKRIESLERRR